MIRNICTIILFSFAFAEISVAQEDDIVRLKHAGQGLVKPTKDLNAPYRNSGPKSRYVPGGGLMMSFDYNEDQHVSMDELARGAKDAFANADANEDGTLSALEQQDWAEDLPTQDDTLANPVRFDPNLDRRVSLEEFSSVILQLGLAYVDQDLQLIKLSDLRAQPKRAERKKQPVRDRAPRRRESWQD